MRLARPCPARNVSTFVIGAPRHGSSSTIRATTSSTVKPGRVDDGRPVGGPQRAVDAGHVPPVALGDRRRHVVDVAADLGDPPLGAGPRRRRDEQLQRGVREHHRADVTALDHAAASLIGPLSLTRPQLLADRRVGGDGADRLGDLAAADLGGRVDAVDEHAGLGDRQVHRPGQLGDGGVVGHRRSPGAGRRRPPPGTSPRCRGTPARGAWRAPCRRCSCPPPPGRRWR